MAKFLIQCPNCGAYHEVKSGFFAKKTCECQCGYTIDIKKDRHTLVQCPSCGNMVMYDQKLGNDAVCPVCHHQLVSEASRMHFIHVTCPTCNTDLIVNKDDEYHTCPLCNDTFSVREEVLKAEIKLNGTPTIVKYEGPTNVLVWRYPVEDFNHGSKLIVHESQETIYIKNGKISNIFTAGIYDLTNTSSDNKDSSHMEVYFVNKTVQTNLKWGTDSKIKLFDPISGLSVELGACGEFGVKIINPKTFFLTSIGTERELCDVNKLNDKFRNLVIGKVKTLIAKVIKDNKINILAIDENKDLIEDRLKLELNTIFTEYGLTITYFNILNIVTPDDDPTFKKLKEQYANNYLLIKEAELNQRVGEVEKSKALMDAETEAQKTIIKAKAEAEAYLLRASAEANEMKMKDFTYADKTKRDVSLKALETNNTPINTALNTSINLAAIKEAFDITKDQYSNAWDCPNCHTKGITSNFCPNCGTKRN